MKTVMVVVADGVVEERNDALTASPIGTKRQVPGPCRQCFPSRRFPADEGPAIATHLRRREGERGGEGDGCYASVSLWFLGPANVQHSSLHACRSSIVWLGRQTLLWPAIADRRPGIYPSVSLDDIRRRWFANGISARPRNNRSIYSIALS